MQALEHDVHHVALELEKKEKNGETNVVSGVLRLREQPLMPPLNYRLLVASKERREVQLGHGE